MNPTTNLDQPPVSIVIPSYNDELTLAACVAGVLANTEYPDWEIIVVEDGSTDKSLARLKPDPRLKILRQPHHGIGAALNAGFRAAGTRDVVRLHADVVIETAGWLGRLVHAVNTLPRAGVVGAKLIYPDGRIQTEGRNIINGLGFHLRHRDRKAFAPNGAGGKAVEVDAVHGGLAYYRREVITAVGGIDEKFGQLWTEDMDFCVAARFHGFKVYVEPAVAAVHYTRSWGPTSVVRIPGTENSLHQVTWAAKQQAERAQAKYWEAKWGWNPFYPDLNEIRRLYGHTEICWQIGEAMRSRPEPEFPAVDCCLVTANNLALLKRCLESLAKTDYPPDRIKVYIADNGSTDGSIAYLESLAGHYPLQIILNKLPLNTGVPVGLNWAVQQGGGQLVARLDDDIVLPPNWLALMVQDLRARPFAGCVGPKILNDDARHGIQCGAFRHFPGLYGHEDEADLGQADYLARAIHVRGCCNLYRREVFARCGLFDLRFSPSQFDDPDHHIALAAAGYEILYEGRVSVIHKLNNGLARSYAAVSNANGNCGKLYGKWGMDVFEVLERALDFSREGRYLPDDGNTEPAWLAAPAAAEFPRRDVLAPSDVLDVVKVLNRELSAGECFNNLNNLAVDYVRFGAAQRRDGFPRLAIDTLNSALSFAPQNVGAIEALALTYLESGQPDMAGKIGRHALNLAPDSPTLRALVQGETKTAEAKPAAVVHFQDKGNYIGEASVLVAGKSSVATQTRRLRVLMVNSFENRTAGGDMHQLKKTKQYLEKLGVEVDVCCTPRPDPRGYDLVHIYNLWFPHQTVAQLKAIRLYAPKIPVVMTPIYWNMAEKAWADIAVPQIFNAATSPEELEKRLKDLASNTLRVNARRRSEAPEPNFSGYTQYQTKILEMVDYLLPQSDAEMANLRQTLGVQKPFNLVRNGAEIEVFEKATADWFVEKYKIRDFVLTVGLIEPRKNQLMLLHALKNAGVPVVVVGRFYDAGYYQLCRRHAPKNTLFIEHLAHEQLASAFKAARVHALPSWMECASFANVEAALSGCSLVVSDRTSEPEYFGKNAYYCDPASVDSIRQAVQSALQNRAADAPKREELHRQFLTQFTWQNAAEQTLRGYEATLALHGLPAIGRQTTVSPPVVSEPSRSLPARPPEAGSAKVSIIIPTFNRLDLTQACLRAIQANTPLEQCEIIVVDNASTDGTAKFVAGEQQAGRLTAISNEKNLGFARACNQGAGTARGKYILFLNNDTEVTPGWLEPLVRTAEADPRIGAVGSKLLFSDGTIQHAGVVILDDRGHHDPLLAQHIFSREPQGFPEASRAKTYQALTAACLLVPQDVFAAAGGFDEGFYNGYEDVDLCFRIAARNKILVYQPASVVIHHESQSGPERFRLAGQNIARLHQKWLGKIQADFIVGAPGESSPGPARRIADYPAPEPVPEDKSPAVSIIILALNQLEHTRACLESIAAHTAVAHEVIVVDNGSTDATAEFLKTWQAGHSNCTVIRNESNRGFAAGNNQGLAIARGKHLLLLNNDTVVTAGWLDAMLAVFVRHPGTGIVGPVSNCVSGPQLVREAVYPNLPEMHAFAGRHAQANAGQSSEVVRAVGFCLLVAQEVVNQIGGLDERFGSGNFEDDDFCIRTQLAGFRIRVARDSFVHHVGSQTFKGAKIDYRQAMLRNWDLFRAKWELPPEASLESGYPIPKQLPKNLALKIALPAPGATHSQRAGGGTEIKRIAPAAAVVKPAPVAQVGRLNEARELLADKKFEAAWQAANTAIGQRPFHPEAFLLLAEIAQAVGDGATARKCGQQARDLAPGWDLAKQFLKRPLKAGVTPGWLKLPAQIQKTAPANRLSVCLIVKNEEQFIGQCLKSVRDIASQIVVVDTGSSDRTVEIAREFGAEISSLTWSDDFAAARNAALQVATGDWVLMLDADEELPEAQHKKLSADMKNAGVAGYRLPLVNAGQEAEGCSYVPRLFRNAPGIYYYGRIHEQIFPSIIPLCRAWGLRTALGTSQLLHHGYTQELVRDRNKVERNLKLLKLALAENPGDVNLVMNLGMELARSGDLDTGIVHYREAYEMMSAQTPQQMVAELREVLLTQYTSQLYKIQGHAEVVRVLSSPLAANGGLTSSLHLTLGLSFFELNDYKLAAENMGQCLARRNKTCLSPINVDIHGAAPNHCLALCLSRMNDPAGAEKAFQAAETAAGSVESVKLDYAKFLSDAKRPVEALQKLNEIIAVNVKHARAWKAGGEIALGAPEFLEFACDWTGEALRALPEDAAIMAQRAEALMLHGDAAEAAKIWQRLAAGQPDSRQQAALILCELAGGAAVHKLEGEADELAVTRSFIEWYQRLISVRANAVVKNVNDRLEKLSQVLPTAAQMIGDALAETSNCVPA